jgi:ABC-type phosphate/phosphonate transport system permease subunit
MLVIAFAAAIFFRFYRLDGVLAEMFSDHAEKLLDVSDVLSGKFSIFFPRNTGREAIQMYLTALVAIVCGTKISYKLAIAGSVCFHLFWPLSHIGRMLFHGSACAFR